MRFYVSRRIGRYSFGASYGPRDFRLARRFSVAEPALGRDFVYVVQGQEAVKIGVTRDLTGRLSNLQTGSSHPLSMAYSTRVRGDAYAVEAEAHSMLARHRIGGEWFAVPADVAVAAINGAAFRLKEFPQLPDSPRSLRIWWPRLLAWFVLGFLFWLAALIAPSIAVVGGIALLFLMTSLTIATPPGSRLYGTFIAVLGWMLALIPAVIVARS